MKKALITLVVLAALGGGGYAYYRYSTKPEEPTVTYATVTRGDILDTVGATGQLEPLEKVQVGTQVSGVILELNADFNSVVRKGQLLARLDPQLIETQILQQEANLIRSQTDVDRNRVSLEDAQKKFERSKELFERGIVNRQDYDTAELQLRSAQSSLKSAEASLKQSEAALQQQRVNLSHTLIYSPIDGIVISRVVDVGQTVNAGQSTPTLFNLAADLAEMRVVAGVDESDMARIRTRQDALFRIDAYPNEVFRGTVSQVRLEPRLQQNVVTYQVVIAVPNRELKLKPGMTANINIEISRREDVLKIPNAALRFRPTNDMYTALGLTPPADSGRGGRGGSADRSSPGTRGAETSGASTSAQPAAAPVGGPQASATPQAARPQAPEAPSAGLGRGRSAGDGENGGSQDFAARMKSMTAEERERMMARGGGRGGFGGRGSGERRSGWRGRGGDSAGRGSGGGGNTLTTADLAAQRNVATIDNLFPPLPPVESRGRVWTYSKEKKSLTSTNLRLGITDGQNTQLLEGDVTDGLEVVTNIITAAGVRPGFNPQQGNPFFQGPGGGRGPGGGGFGPPGGGGGGNRGGGSGRGF